jgi:hypothetical protein
MGNIVWPTVLVFRALSRPAIGFSLEHGEDGKLLLYESEIFREGVGPISVTGLLAGCKTRNCSLKSERLVDEEFTPEGSEGALGGEAERDPEVGEVRVEEVEEASEEDVEEAKEEDVEEAKEEDVEEANEEDVGEAEDKDVGGAKEDVEEETEDVGREKEGVEEVTGVEESLLRLSLLILL